MPQETSGTSLSRYATGRTARCCRAGRLHESPEAIAAIDNGIRPVTCADLANSADTRAFLRVGGYAENYNRRMLELTKKQAK